MTDLTNTVISISVMGSIGAIITLLAKIIISGKISARADLYIWIPVIVRLIVPYIPDSSASVYNYIPNDSMLYTPASILYAPYNVPHESEINLLPYIWLFVALIVAIFYAASYFRFLKSINPCCPVSADIEKLIEKAKTTCGFSANVRVIICKNNISPMIAGFLKPKLIVPESALNIFSREQLEIIFIHEITHLKRRDHYLNALLIIISCLHWFNPIVHYVISQIKKDAEKACDEKALKLFGEDEKYAYSQTLINLSGIFCESKSDRCVSTMANGKRTLKNRIKRIYNIGKRKFSIIALPVCVIITVTFMTGATGNKASAITESVIKNIEPIVKLSENKTGQYTEVSDDPALNQNTEMPHEYSAEHPSEIYEFADTKTGFSEKNNTTDVSGNPIAGTDNTRTQHSTSENLSSDKTDASTQHNSGTNASHEPLTPNHENFTADKTYIYSGSGVVASLSNDPTKSGFAYESDNLKIETVGIISATDESFKGYFNIYKDGEAVHTNVRANVSASPTSIVFNDEHSSENDFSFDVKTKTIS